MCDYPLTSNGQRTKCIQCIPTLTCEKITCQKLNQTNVKIKCALRNEHINGLVINHSPAPLPEQE
jgi:hypothetical protein